MAYRDERSFEDWLVDGFAILMLAIVIVAVYGGCQ